MKVVIIGAGASGLMSACVVSDLDNSVILLNKAAKPGKKILMTGNGKCNMSNTHIDKTKYNEEAADFALNIINKFNTEKTLDFFKKIGVLTYDKDGYVYPCSNQALTVLERLMDYCKNQRVKIIDECQVKEVDKHKVITDKGVFDYDKVIFATGGITSKKTGSDGSGYELLKKLGHSIKTPKEVLCGVCVSNKGIKDISGVREKCRATLIIDSLETDYEDGECQFTDYGLSGICIFNLSIKISASLDNKKQVFVVLDLSKNRSFDEIKAYFDSCIKDSEYISVLSLINSLVNKKIAGYICRELNIKPHTPACKLNEKDLINIIKMIKGMKFNVTSLRGGENSQATLGGVPISEVNMDTLESKKCKNVYIAGEVLDVTGKCGGYNLQFAWSSGYVAGLCK